MSYHNTTPGREILSNALDAYVKYKVSTRSWKSENSAKNNQSTLRSFIREVAKVLRREPLTDDLSDTLIIPVISARWPDNGRTKTHYINYERIKTFVGWLRANRYDIGPVDVFLGTVPVVPETEVQFLTREEAETTFQVVHPYAPRDAHLVWIAFLLWRRPAEMARLRVGDINLKSQRDAEHGTYTYTETKGHKGRVTERLTSGQREAIDRWLTEYRELIGTKLKNDWYLFPKTVGVGSVDESRKRPRKLMPEQPMRHPSRIFADSYRAAGVKRWWMGGHAARRGGATDGYDALEDAGVPDPLLHVQRRLGHTNPRISARYIRRDEGKVKTYKAFQLVDDIRVGKTPAPQVPHVEQDKKDSGQSLGDTGQDMAKVIHLPFGRRRA